MTSSSLRIELIIIAEESTRPEGGPPTYAIGMGIVPANGGLVDYDTIRILQRGYASPKHALAALLECLTFSPPDLSTYDEGLAYLSGLLDRTGDLESAITSVGGRLNDVEEKVEAMAGPVPAGRQLLPPRVAPAGQPTAPAQPQNANPQIRRPAGRTMISAGHGAGGRVNGSPPMAITGGVGRRGDLGPTGAGADDEGEITEG